jgi:hypothetical protein
MTLVIIIASVLTGAIAGWWLTATIATTIKSRFSTRTVRQWQDRALAAEAWKLARQRQDGQPGAGNDNTTLAA